MEQFTFPSVPLSDYEKQDVKEASEKIKELEDWKKQSVEALAYEGFPPIASLRNLIGEDYEISGIDHLNGGTIKITVVYIP